MLEHRPSKCSFSKCCAQNNAGPVNLDTNCAAMSLVESKPAFRKRCEEIRNGVHDELVKAGVETFSLLAYVLGTPGASIDEQALKSFASDLEHPGNRPGDF